MACPIGDALPRATFDLANQIKVSRDEGVATLFVVPAWEPPSDWLKSSLNIRLMRT